ncbi:MAG: patatin-like phospholipase family protein [Planctomycetes bacterium]|nr:patatin-like phospholipase family protein [Planctomycetota bacterium]
MLLYQKKVFGVFVFLFVFLCGCSLPRNPVPVSDISRAQISGFEDIRDWGGEHSEIFQRDIVESMRQEKEGEFPRNPDGSLNYHALALSGGGENGAFGAGFLCGWTKSGNRPNFKLVTGISTGSLMAPIVFLGPEYDAQLKEAYTTANIKTVYKERNILSLLWSDSFADTAPLHHSIVSQITPEVLEAIAVKHSQGYRLYIGTTDMDAGRLMVWNMGVIAGSGHPDARELFGDILLASASIPGAFPPMFFDVEVDGVHYDEMHSDGNTTTNVFFHGFMLDLAAARREVFGADAPATASSLYIMRDGRLAATEKQVKRRLPNIIGRALSLVTTAQARGDLYRIYAITQKEGIDFNYVDIPDDYVPVSTKAFDTVEMNNLFEMGFKLAGSKDSWHKIPPGLGLIEAAK